MDCADYPILSKQIAIVDNPLEPFAVTVDHQAAVTQCTKVRIISPVAPGYGCACENYCIKGLGKVYSVLRLLSHSESSLLPNYNAWGATCQ